jgi:hypothetical protein
MSHLKLTIKKEKIAILFAFIVFLSGLFFDSLVVFIEGLLLLIIVILALTKISKNELKILVPLVLILLIGILFASGDKYIIAKDIWYFFKPIMYIMLGFAFYRWKVKEESFMGIILLISICSAIIRIILFAFFTSDAQGINNVRLIVGAGNFLESYSLAFIISKRRFSSIKNYLRLPFLINILILSASIILSFSRTGYLVFFISLLALNDYFIFNIKTIFRSLIKLVVIFSILISSLFIANQFFNKNTLFYQLSNKYLNTFTEISTETKYKSKQQINDNWRGYETLLVKQEIKRGTILQKIAGFGFGKTIFIGYEGWLGKNNINIPIFHNGFIQIQLKTGYLGLLLYFIFFIYIFSKINFEKSNRGNLLKAVLISSFFSTLVITGLYNKINLDTSCIMIGYFYSRIFLEKV